MFVVFFEAPVLVFANKQDLPDAMSVKEAVRVWNLGNL